MPRKPRIEFPGAFYHVMARGNRKQDIFVGDRGKERFLEKLSEYKERYGFILYAFTLMPNHLHLLLEAGLEPLSRIMQGILQSHTQWFNSKHTTVGHLFQGRYKSILCDKDSYLLALVRYQHLNCVRAGLVSDPSRYRWSSHRIYLGLEKSDLVDTEFVLSLFSKNSKRAIKIYHRYILDGMKEENEFDFSELSDNGILGDEKFYECATKKAGRKIISYEDGEIDLPLKQILQAVARIMGIPEDDIKGSRRGGKFVKARSLFAHGCRKYSKADNRQVSRFLNRSESTISNLIRRYSSKELEKKISMIKQKSVS